VLAIRKEGQMKRRIMRGVIFLAVLYFSYQETGFATATILATIWASLEMIDWLLSHIVREIKAINDPTAFLFEALKKKKKDE
jgi:hypothetical protein